MNCNRILIPSSGHLADANTRLRHPAENAAWIWHPSRPAGETAVLRFTLAFDLASPASPVIHVTGDQRFQLRCDGNEVSFGPDRCDLEHWTVQSLRMELAAGRHEFEAIVWWLADPDSDSRTDQSGADPLPRPPMAQMTWRGGFLLHSDDLPVSTGTADWQVADLTDVVRLFRQRIPHYFDVGPSYEFDLKGWVGAQAGAPTIVAGPLEQNIYGVRRPGWCLHPASLPEQRRQIWTGGRIRAVRAGWGEETFSESADAAAAWQSVLDGGEIAIPPHSEVTVLWDMEQYRCGYPWLSVQGGAGARIEWDWAEALYEAPSSAAVDTLTAKGHRGEIEGKSFLGFGDRWRIGLAGGRVPFLWWRSGRYIRLRVRTADQPLLIQNLGILATGYPLDRSGGWTSSDPGWDCLFPIFENSYRCSAHEQWTDSPYYEQMGYVGDSLLHSLSNYVLFPDDRVTRRSIELFEWSRRPSGLVAERYPSAWRQESVTYSMLWLMMVRDYVNWRDDPDFVRGLLPGVRGVLAEIECLRHENGLLVEAPGWPFVDWVPEWDTGCGPGVREGDSSIFNLHYVLCLQAAAEIEDAHGDPALAVRCRRVAGDAFSAVLSRYWDEKRGLLLDTVGHEKASEHAQVFALLTGLLDPEKSRRCLKALRDENDLSRTTIYAAFYLLDALYRRGEEAGFHGRLEFWRALPDLGFTATPEAPEPSRSDAHAWGSHPAWHSLASIAGIRPSAPGFRSVRIAPCPGPLKNIDCSMPHPLGLIEASLEFDSGNVSATITLPPGLSGTFLWRGSQRDLTPGTNHFRS